MLNDIAIEFAEPIVRYSLHFQMSSQYYDKWELAMLNNMRTLVSFLCK